VWWDGEARRRFEPPATCVAVCMTKDMVGDNTGRAVESLKISTRDFDVAGGVEAAVAVVIKRVSRRIGYSITGMDDLFEKFLGV
jgi:hypothetical protein